MRIVKAAWILVASLLSCCALTGCLVVGYSSDGGWWMWRGSLVITLLLMLAWLLSRR